MPPKLSSRTRVITDRVIVSFLVFLGLIYRAIGLTIVELNNGTEWITSGKCYSPFKLALLTRQN